MMLLPKHALEEEELTKTIETIHAVAARVTSVTRHCTRILGVTLS
jgi:hypothetical protein